MWTLDEAANDPCNGDDASDLASASRGTEGRVEAGPPTEMWGALLSSHASYPAILQTDLQPRGRGLWFVFAPIRHRSRRICPKQSSGAHADLSEIIVYAAVCAEQSDRDLDGK